LLHARASHRYEGELGRDEKPVRKHQQRDGRQ
jgi:hypothetical protein